MSAQYTIQFQPKRCIACGACAVACMDQNDWEPRGPLDMFRKITVTETGHGADAKMIYRSTGCLHCADAPCMDACPQGCLSRDPDTGFVLCDNTDCIGCRQCAAVCPVGAPVFTPEGKMAKCTGCNERVKHGLEPACVRGCPFDALLLVDRAKEAAPAGT